ncbi:basic proline-rich protein-like [Pithys albifrons albifrons]|uniref:basic proline-rich protein-like n=1 Tax=Pithys albifrons albifrons TaxID=3385563 RepID=UPI003A5CB34F
MQPLRQRARSTSRGAQDSADGTVSPCKPPPLCASPQHCGGSSQPPQKTLYSLEAAPGAARELRIHGTWERRPQTVTPGVSPLLGVRGELRGRAKTPQATPTNEAPPTLNHAHKRPRPSRHPPTRRQRRRRLRALPLAEAPHGASPLAGAAGGGAMPRARRARRPAPSLSPPPAPPLSIPPPSAAAGRRHRQARPGRSVCPARPRSGPEHGEPPPGPTPQRRGALTRPRPRPRPRPGGPSAPVSDRPPRPAPPGPARSSRPPGPCRAVGPRRTGEGPADPAPARTGTLPPTSRRSGTPDPPGINPGTLPETAPPLPVRPFQSESPRDLP